MTEQIQISSATGVDLKLHVAGPGARSYAFVVDWHIRVLLALAWILGLHWIYTGSFTLIDSDSANFERYMAVVLLPALAIYLLYHPVLEIAMRGRTPGKRTAGIRIVSEDAQEPSVLAVLIRNVLRLLDGLPAGYVVGLVATVITRNSVRIGDIAAGTLLVYEGDKHTTDRKTLGLSVINVGEHTLDKMELAEDLLDRWKALDLEVRKKMAGRVIISLNPDAVPAATDTELQNQLEGLLMVREQEADNAPS